MTRDRRSLEPEGSGEGQLQRTAEDSQALRAMVDQVELELKYLKAGILQKPNELAPEEAENGIT